MKSKLNIILCLSLLFLASCGFTTEDRVRRSGSIVPRNHREKVIFEYFNALKEQRYEDAYNLQSRYDEVSNVQQLERFIEIHEERHLSLATEISIGEEEKWGEDNHDERCGYIYLVYATLPNNSGRVSGNVALVSHPQDPQQCLIYYNSAFGSAP